MRPAAWLNMVHYSSTWDFDANFILDSIYHGFHMVDHGASLQSYHMENYGSSLSNPQLISELLHQEISQGKILVTDIKPNCVHFLGAIFKPSGKIRPITDNMFYLKADTLRIPKLSSNCFYYSELACLHKKPHYKISIEV